MAKRETVPENLSLEEAAWLEAASSYVQELETRFNLVESEVAVGVDWVSNKARFTGTEDRNYPDWAGYMFGTMDLLCQKTSDDPAGFRVIDELYVGDWKTGGTDGAEEQLLSLLAASVKALQYEGYQIPKKLLISCLRVSEEGVWPHEREVSPEELDAHWQAMSWQAEKIGQKYDPLPGIWCTQLYCPHLAYCSAIGEALDQAAEMDDKLNQEYKKRRLKLTGQPADGQEAAYVMERLSAAKRQLNYLTECMKQYVRQGGQIISGKWQWSDGKDGFRWRKVR